MIPSRLNLLSQEKRKHLQNMVYFQFIKSVLEIILIILCLSGIILLGAQTVLENYFSGLNSTIAFMQSKYVKTNREVREINNFLSELDKLQKKNQISSPRILDIASAVPNGVVLNTVNINYGAKTMSISGEALTRDNLLEFGENVKKIGWIQSSDMPLSQLTKKDNILFSLSAVIK